MAKMKKRINGSWVQSSDTFPVRVGEVPILQEKTVIPAEQEQEMTADNGFTGLGRVIVSAISRMFVGSGVTRQSTKTVTPTKSEQTAVASGVYTTGDVMVGAIPDQYIIPSGSQTITENGEVDVTSLASVNVAIPFSTIYYGSDTPNASFGNDGDIYIKR